MSDPSAIYEEVTFGRDEPEVMWCTAGHARQYLDPDIAPNIADDVIIVITAEGWEVA